MQSKYGKNSSKTGNQFEVVQHATIFKGMSSKNNNNKSLLIVHKAKVDFYYKQTLTSKTGSVAFSNSNKTDEYLARQTLGGSSFRACPDFKRKDKTESKQVN